ncbi:hypothetical protein K470DRAFT_260768 [Piedraia hortae CBS 480.64]|uniref:Uncharacterized protein n=1 Tax=Piedraia hortae CBS 480.64 TaxID=1314780 RepID=A0A6A7BQ99_9PEZI|nr:hypothetical protein K470DRAFT_260768 [Piedraia hortae CBS 480.64]
MLWGASDAFSTSRLEEKVGEMFAKVQKEKKMADALRESRSDGKKPSQSQNTPPTTREKLLNCPLKQLVQYECDLRGPREDPKSKVYCEPVIRFFRICEGFTVETTEWEE